jgi:hypothetical protein
MLRTANFYVSDLIRAYHRNIPGGVESLFSHVITLDLAEYSGSILQRYALEDKEPIFIDRKPDPDAWFCLGGAKVFAEGQLRQRGSIQHDPDAMAKAIKGLWALHHAGWLNVPEGKERLPAADFSSFSDYPLRIPPCLRMKRF